MGGTLWSKAGDASGKERGSEEKREGDREFDYYAIIVLTVMHAMVNS